MLALQVLFAHVASGLLTGLPFRAAPHGVRPHRRPAMQVRDEQGYIEKSELGDWTNLEKSTALGATVTEWKDLPETVQPIVTAVKE